MGVIVFSCPDRFLNLRGSNSSTNAPPITWVVGTLACALATLGSVTAQSRFGPYLF